MNLLDARGHAVSESYGNGLWVQNGFHALTGEAVTRKAGTGGAETNVQHLLYSWDTAGNLTSRQDLRQSLTESFSYDALDRLTSTTGPGGTLTVAYDAIGNITSRSDVGSYTYHVSKKHAVVAAGSNSYAYDANGNLVTRNGASITWTSANLPATINAAGYSATFSYAPDRARWRQVSTYAGGTETTIYVGGLMEKLTTPVRTHWKHLIPTPSGQVQVIRRSDGTTETLYLTTDHLGSTEAVLNAAGAVLARTSFAAWGARRASNWQGSPSPGEWQAIADTTRRGYTGHEHLDNILLVHMNRRVYDPAIGRFLSADPFVDGVEGSQGWNRYSYVKNNPLAFTDPTGFSSEPPSTPILPIDPGPASVVFVDASRLNDRTAAWALIAFRQMLDAPSVIGYTEEGLEEVTVTVRRPRETPMASLPGSGPGTPESQATPQSPCYAPFIGGDSFVSSYAASLGNLGAGALESFSGGLELGAQISGSVNLFSLKPGFSAGMFNGSLSLTGAGNLTLSVKSPTPGRLTYGEASLSVGPVKVGAASASVTEGISTRSGSFTQANEGFSGMAKATTWKSDLGKVGAHLQIGVGVKAEWDISATLRAVDCALGP